MYLAFCLQRLAGHWAARELIHRQSHSNGVITVTHTIYKYDRHTDLVSIRQAQNPPIKHCCIKAFSMRHSNRQN